MNNYYSCQTNIISAYAGRYINKDKLIRSSSGGIASALSEMIIKEEHGIVYGATYSNDMYKALYARIDDIKDLECLKGSKYAFVEKSVTYNNKSISVYEAVANDLKAKKTVLFIGLGCDVFSLKAYCEKNRVKTQSLYLVELLCDGVTTTDVHKQYIQYIERIHNSKVIDFTVRYKRDGWVPLYIRALFENGEQHIIPFYKSDYGYAFSNYKRKCCYSCQFKGKNRYGDLTLGDYWGCYPGMLEYNNNGVSIIYTQTEKGNHLIQKLDRESIDLNEINPEYALNYSPRYFNSHPYNDKIWNQFDCNLSRYNLRRSVKVCSKVIVPNSSTIQYEDLVIWGTGKCFHELAPYVLENRNVSYVVDSDEDKWGKASEYGYICNSPEIITQKNNVFVLIMVYSVQSAFQIANRLLNMGINNFDHIENWILYYENSNYK